METVIMLINKNWFWFGPVLVTGAFIAVVYVIYDLFSGVDKEIQGL